MQRRYGRTTQSCGAKPNCLRRHGAGVCAFSGIEGAVEPTRGNFIGRRKADAGAGQVCRSRNVDNRLIWFHNRVTMDPNQLIPPFTKYGFLPSGTYEANLTNVHDRFATISTSRQHLWERFMEFIEVIRSDNIIQAFQAIEIGGSFLTAKTDPSDIDVALEFRRIEKPIESVLALLTKERVNQIKCKLGVQVFVKKVNSEPYIDRVPSDLFMSDSLELFRKLNREERALIVKTEKRYPYEDLKGIIRVVL